MEKKEYQPPKMEIVQMVALGNLLSGSPGDDPGEVIDVDVDDEE